MKVQIDPDNYLIFDQEHGGRILQLKLAGTIVIRGNHSDTGSGSFLMFPWVNRVEQLPQNGITPPYTDGNGLPIHGLCVDSPRKATVYSISAQSIGIDLVPNQKHQIVPEFIEQLILTRGKLTTTFRSLNHAQYPLPVCFGYHPYFQIDQHEIKDLSIKTDIKTKLSLDDKMLPVWPYQKQIIQIKSTEKYDTLFEGGTHFQLVSKQGFNLRIESNLPYWQIYTPPDGKRIAVEPMSFTGNVYRINSLGFTPSVKEGSWSISAWRQK